MSNRDFGGLVRRSRERLGLSQTRLGELVGRAASTIRAWERGQAVPTDPTAVSSLAAVLGLDEPELFALAGLDPPLLIEDHPTIEQSLREIAPRVAPPAATPPPVQESLLDGESGSEPLHSEMPKAEDGRPSAGEVVRALEFDPEPLPSLDALLASLEAPPPVPAAAAPSLVSGTAPPSGVDVTPAFDNVGNASTVVPGLVPSAGPAAEPEMRRRDLRTAQAPTATPSVLDRFRDLTVRWRSRPRPKRPPAPVGIASAPSYVEVPEQRVVYLRRRVYTAVAVFIALLLAVWSYGAAKTALTETLDQLLSGF